MTDVSWQSVLARLGVVAVLVLANAFFVAAEFALVSSRRTRIEAMIRRGNAKAKLARRALLRLDRSISGTQLGITLASLGLGWVGEPTIAHTIESLFAALGPLAPIATHGVAGTLAFLGITFLHIVLGELTPKALALLYPETTSTWVAGPLLAFTVATNPFIWLLKGSANLVLRPFGQRAPTTLERLHSPEELRMLVDQSANAGKLDRDDARLLAGVFEFSEKTARQVMTPRTEIVALDLDASLTDAADLIARARRSRYPVARASLDDIAGIVHAKDVLAALRAAGGTPARLAELVRPVHFVPGSREIEDVLADMKLMRVHMVIVLDEFGGTAGLVTMEDLLEEIVGQIYDEYDRPAQPRPSGTALPPGAALPGNLTLAEVNARCGLTLASADYTTLGGFLFGKLGRLPKVGDRITAEGGSFEILSMDGRRISEARYVKG